jgi:hypothetical protein
MSSRRLLPSVVTALAVLVVFNLAVAAATRVTARRKFLDRVEGSAPDTQLLFLGNSLMEYGADPAAFQAAWTPAARAPRSVNAGLHATSPVEHALILQQALARLPQVNTVIYGVFDDQLSLRQRSGWRDMISSRALSYSFPTQAAALYAPGSMATQWRFRAMALLPMLADRTTLWSKVETLRQALSARGLPSRPAPEEDLTELAGRLETVVREKRELSPAVREIFRLAQDRRLQVVVVEMPSGHPASFHDGPAASALRDYSRAQVEAAGGHYLDASDWILERELYREDGSHLNPTGAQRFSERLARELARTGGPRRGG